MTRNRRKGFSLIELVIVIVIISVGLVGIASQFGNNTTSLSTNETLQQATQYAQECAELAISQRRNQGFDSFAATPFSCGTDPANFTRTANPVGAIYTGVSSGACNGHDPCPCPYFNSAGLSCRDVSIIVTSTANNALNASVTLMLVNY